MEWRKSSYSSAQGGQCVEVASADGVMVRDTTNRDGGTLSFTAEAWREFIHGSSQHDDIVLSLDHSIAGNYPKGRAAMNWRKPSYSNDSGGECVELASDNGMVAVRDTKNRSGGALAFSAAAWREFLTRIA